MQTVLEAILPFYLRYIKDQTTKRDNPGAARDEVQIISNIAVSIRALVISCEPLTRSAKA